MNHELKQNEGEMEAGEMTPGSESPFGINVVELLKIIWDSRSLLLKVLIAGLILSAGGSFLLPNYYESTTVLLPASNGISSLASGTLSSLASLAGVNIGSSSPEMLYPSIITSEAILKDIIYAKLPTGKGHMINWIEYDEIDEGSAAEDYESALESLRQGLVIGVDKDNSIVTVSLMTTDPVYTAEVLNALVIKLDEFLRTKSINTASEQRKWIEDRLRQVEKDLAKSEDTLKVFSEKNRKITGSPQLILEQGRLMREVEINSTLYMELKKQLELIKIEEIKNVPVVNIMDVARPAAEKAKPKRVVIVVVVMLLTFLGMISYVLSMHYYQEEITEILAVFKPRFPRLDAETQG